VGRQVEIGGLRYRVVGVVEDVSMARYSAWADIWVPHGTVSSTQYRAVSGGGQCTGLLLARSTADFPRIRAEIVSRLKHLEMPPPFTRAYAYPMTRFEHIVHSHSLNNPRDGRPPVGRVLLLWLGMTAGFLLLPTVNLVNLNLSRILERAPEIGVRKAFGASSLDLVGQFVVENVLLCLIGSLLGLVLAVALLEGVEASGVLPHARFDLNPRVFAYAAALGLFFGALSGALPAWRMSRLHPVTALRGGQR
jgi:putative ABC transport system permease protein